MDFSNSYLDDLERGTLPLKEVTDEAPPIVRLDASNRQPGEDGAWNQQRAHIDVPTFLSNNYLDDLERRTLPSNTLTLPS